MHHQCNGNSSSSSMFNKSNAQAEQQQQQQQLSLASLPSLYHQQQQQQQHHQHHPAIAAAIAAAARLVQHRSSEGARQSNTSNGNGNEWNNRQMMQANRSMASFTASTVTPPQEHSNSNSNDSEDEDPSDTAERRMARSRERNREHARKTRLRKKAQMEALQRQVKGLQAERKVLQQSLEDCSMASILVGLHERATAAAAAQDASNDSSSSSDDNSSSNNTITKQDMISTLLVDATRSEAQSSAHDEDFAAWLASGKRKRFVSADLTTNAENSNTNSSNDASHLEEPSSTTEPLKIMIQGKMTSIGGERTHINWKTGVYTDQVGHQRQLTQKQLESLRRERNRMHAKMTRDRKKSFIATMERTIQDLQNTNRRMRDVLQKVTVHHFHSSAPLPGLLSDEEGKHVPSVITDSPLSTSSTITHDEEAMMPLLSLGMPSLKSSGRPKKRSRLANRRRASPASA